MSFKSAVKNSIKSHTLFDEIGGFIINKSGYANRYMSGINAMYKTYTKINRKYKNVLNSSHIEKYNDKDMSNTVWVCWLQGIDNAPDLVKTCYASMKHHIKNMDIIVLDESNLFDYVSFPDYIVEKWKKGTISNTHFSDLIRVNLLNRHGGLWLDLTVYLTGELPQYITDGDFFVYRNGWFNDEMINMGSWLMYSKPNNILLLESENLLFEYWKNKNFLQQYFLLHIFFRMATEKYPDEWKKVPYYNQIDQHILAFEMNRAFDEKRFNQIKEITSVHKLTNKTEKMEFENSSYYSRLSEIYR